MNSLLPWIQEHAQHAHFALFGLALLAGMSFPISIDLLMIIGGTLAATVIPDHFYHLFFSLFIGCVLAAWIAYTLGRFVGRQLLTTRFFSKLFSPKRLNKMKRFYTKRGLFALVIGRFIPFGVRNALYMSCGMSRLRFWKFALWDTLACFLWSVVAFGLSYTLGKNIDVLYGRLKWINLAIFGAFSVTVIGIIWYKKRKKAKEENV